MIGPRLALNTELICLGMPSLHFTANLLLSGFLCYIAIILSTNWVLLFNKDLWVIWGLTRFYKCFIDLNFGELLSHRRGEILFSIENFINALQYDKRPYIAQKCIFIAVKLSFQLCDWSLSKNVHVLDLAHDAGANTANNWQDQYWRKVLNCV